MKTLKYKVIASEEQYDKYCALLEDLVFVENKTEEIKVQISLLTLLVETWDNQHRILSEQDPIALLHSLMEEHKMKAKDLVDLLGISKSSVLDILSYNRGLSKEAIRKLTEHFKLTREAFNRPYMLKSE